MWPERYKKILFSYLLHTCHPTIERKMALGTLPDCLQYHHKVTKTLVVANDVTAVHEPMRS